MKDLDVLGGKASSGHIRSRADDVLMFVGSIRTAGSRYHRYFNSAEIASLFPFFSVWPIPFTIVKDEHHPIADLIRQVYFSTPPSTHPILPTSITFPA